MPFISGMLFNCSRDTSKMRRVPRRRFLAPCLSIVGVAVLCYVLGAVVMFFQLPSSGVLGKALIGAREWYGGEPSSPPVSETAAPIARRPVDRPGETDDGFTLFARSLNGRDLATEALLMNMQCHVVHRWAVPFSRIFPDQSHLRTRLPDMLACFFDCRLFPNGDLLAVVHGRTVPAGVGLVRLDKESHVLWAYPSCVHHDIDVTEDGTIYALQEEVVSDKHEGTDSATNSRLADYLVVLSPEGKLLKEPISIREALRDSPYAAFLASLEEPKVQPFRPPGSTAPHVDSDLVRNDPLHPNCVRVLRPELASAFPSFKVGNVLLSLRNLSMVVMLDPERGTVVWASRGPWYAQHDAQFLENGHLLIFDNLGSPQGSRVLEYDPQSQAVPWSYTGEGATPFYTSERGMCQRLPNGNTFIVNSEGGDLIEVTRGKRIVWACSLGGYITTARRLSPGQVPFLGGGLDARP